MRTKVVHETEEFIDESLVNNATTTPSRTVEDLSNVQDKLVEQGSVIENVTLDNKATNAEMDTEQSNLQCQGHEELMNDSSLDTGTSFPFNV